MTDTETTQLLTEPTDEWKALANEHMDKANWKRPTTRPYYTPDPQKAEAMHKALSFYLGGAETETTDRGWFKVTSKGYYHYIGA